MYTCFTDVEFTMPLRPDSKKRLNTSDEQPKNSSFDSCYDTMEDTKSVGPQKDEEDEDDPDHFLTQLGLESDLINKINTAQVISCHLLLNCYCH